MRWQPPPPPKDAEPLRIDVRGEAWTIVIPRYVQHHDRGWPCDLLEWLIWFGLLLVFGCGSAWMTFGYLSNLWEILQGRMAGANGEFLRNVLGLGGFGFFAFAIWGGLFSPLFEQSEYISEEVELVLTPGCVRVRSGEHPELVLTPNEAPRGLRLRWYTVSVVGLLRQRLFARYDRSPDELRWLANLGTQFLRSGRRSAGKDAFLEERDQGTGRDPGDEGEHDRHGKA